MISLNRPNFNQYGGQQQQTPQHSQGQGQGQAQINMLNSTQRLG